MSETMETSIETGSYGTYLNRSGEGNDEAVLFLQGSGPGATAWSNWQFALPALGERFDCLAPDLIGYGKSDHPDEPPQGVTPWLDIWVNQQIELLDNLGLEKAHLVGNSMGGGCPCTCYTAIPSASTAPSSWVPWAPRSRSPTG